MFMGDSLSQKIDSIGEKIKELGRISKSQPRPQIWEDRAIVDDSQITNTEMSDDEIPIVDNEPEKDKIINALIESTNGDELGNKMSALGIDTCHWIKGSDKERYGTILNMINEDNFPDTSIFQCPLCYAAFDDEEQALAHIEEILEEARENIEQNCMF
jgi:hypothetical protein